MTILPYSPGVLPKAPAPANGERIIIKVAGLPPYKEMRRSIRNPKHPRYDSFVALRTAATLAMAGRAWYFDAIGLNLMIHAPKLHKGRRLSDYMAGIADTLDGSCGFTFTYLPIVYQDDSQVFVESFSFVPAQDERYQLEVDFLRFDNFVQAGTSMI